MSPTRRVLGTKPFDLTQANLTRRRACQGSTRQTEAGTASFLGAFLYGSNPNATSWPIVATNTFPFATSGADHLAVKSKVSRAALWLLL